MLRTSTKRILAGILAGTLNGLFGAGGGMALVPMLTKLTDMTDDEIFPSSISIILPICCISLLISAFQRPLPIMDALPYLISSAVGGFAAGKLGAKVPTLWLHKLLGGLIIWGGLRYLWH